MTRKRFEMPAGGEAVPPEYTALLEELDRWAMLLDSRYRIPGTPIRFGWDAIVGLVPILGDLATTVASLRLITLARRLGATRAMTAVMIGNVLADGLIGAIPLAGSVFDVLFRANERNLALLVAEIARRRNG
ncbi:MAG: DUF4112 domain-containing protein [Hyphomicrobiaceae bacterium]|mgnify:CR=1 FL=1